MNRLITCLLPLLPMTVLAWGGWQPNGMGGVYGTGDNTGSGWQPNGIGGYYGTGGNAGRTCQPNGVGGMNCY